MYLDPRHLAQLSMIVEAGSFQSAADRLGLSQPAVSRNMRVLESRLHAPLFVRSGRRAVPTRLGQRLARSGLAVRIAQEQAESLSDRAASGMAGQLRIGAPPAIAGRFLTRHLSRFIDANADCAVELRVGLVHELRAMLERGQIDLVIAPRMLAEERAELTFEPLIDDRVGVLCRADHSLVTLECVSAAELQRQVWVAHSRGSLLRRQTEAALLACGVENLRIGFETDSIHSVLEVVAETDLLSTLPRETSRAYLGDSLVFLAFDHPQFLRPIGVTLRRDATPSQVVDRFVAELRRGVRADDPGNGFSA